MPENPSGKNLKGTERVSPACIRDIFLHSRADRRQKLIEYSQKTGERNDDNCTEYLNIYSNMTEIRPKNRPKGASSKKSGGTKREITEFSRKSRRNFIKFLCKIDEPVELWQDFTFADDIMAGKSIIQRRNISNRTLNRFRRIVKERYPTLWAIYKREWQSRKSGSLSGEYIPHFHMFMAERNQPEGFDYLALAHDLAVLWVQCTKTEEFDKALRVACHSKSYRLIESQKQAMIYASKYVVKNDAFHTDESIGRSWGTIGDIKIGTPKIVELTPDEAVRFKRVVRKTINKKKKELKKSLSRPETATFVIIKEETTDTILKYVNDVLEWECRSFFAEVA